MTMRLRLPAVSVHTVPTDAPEADGTLVWEATTMVVTEVTAGEATGTGWTYGPRAVGDFLRGQLAPLVEGRDASAIPAVHDAMCRSVRNAGRQGIAACAISALDIALWDHKARLGAARRRVPVYGSGGFTTYDDTHMAAQLGGWAHGQQIPRVKIKIGESWAGRSPLTWPGSVQRVKSSAPVRSCTSTPTARTPASRRSGSAGSSPSWGWAGSRNRCRRTTSVDGSGGDHAGEVGEVVAVFARRHIAHHRVPHQAQSRHPAELVRGDLREGREDSPRAGRATRSPRAAKARAVARPTPPPAPVTTTALPRR